MDNRPGMTEQRTRFHVDESKPWLQPEAGWPEQVPKNLDFPSLTLYEMLTGTVEKHPDMPVIWFLDSFMSYRELHRHVDAFGDALHGLGLRKGDVVALALPSCFQYVIAYYACARQGLIVAGVNPTYKPGEVLHELRLTGAKAMVVPVSKKLKACISGAGPLHKNVKDRFEEMTGTLDQHGRVTLHDRKKQLIKVKGYSVFPTEVEQLMGAHEAVSEVAVAGLPDPETGEAVKAWVVLKPEWKGKLPEENLRAWCKENMTRYKVPNYVQYIEEIPKTLVGKVMRRELQEWDPIYKAYYRKQP